MPAAKREVRNLIILIASSLIVAFGVVVGILYYASSHGTYRANQVLVSGEKTNSSNQESHTPYVYNKIEFVHADRQGKGWGRYAVSQRAYEEFYKKVRNARSLHKLSDQEVAGFEQGMPSTLTLHGQGGKIYSQIEFLDEGDLFRVRHRTKDGSEEWVYFRLPGIRQEVDELFRPEDSSHE